MNNDNYKTSIRRGSAILMTIFLLFGITGVTMIGTEIVMNGLLSRRVQGASLKAYYSAESAAERTLNQFKVNKEAPFEKCKTESSYLQWNDTDMLCANNKQTAYMDPLIPGTYNPLYLVKAQAGLSSGPRQVDINATANYDIRGVYERVSRQLYIQFCLPQCPTPGMPDGCGRECK